MKHGSSIRKLLAKLGIASASNLPGKFEAMCICVGRTVGGIGGMRSTKTDTSDKLPLKKAWLMG